MVVVFIDAGGVEFGFEVAVGCAGGARGAGVVMNVKAAAGELNKRQATRLLDWQ